jgi:hypothetical protein
MSIAPAGTAPVNTPKQSTASASESTEAKNTNHESSQTVGETQSSTSDNKPPAARGLSLPIPAVDSYDPAKEKTSMQKALEPSAILSPGNDAPIPGAPSFPSFHVNAAGPNSVVISKEAKKTIKGKKGEVEVKTSGDVTLKDNIAKKDEIESANGKVEITAKSKNVKIKGTAETDGKKSKVSMEADVNTDTVEANAKVSVNSDKKVSAKIKGQVQSPDGKTEVKVEAEADNTGASGKGSVEHKGNNVEVKVSGEGNTRDGFYSVDGEAKITSNDKKTSAKVQGHADPKNKEAEISIVHQNEKTKIEGTVKNTNGNTEGSATVEKKGENVDVKGSVTVSKKQTEISGSVNVHNKENTTSLEVEGLTLFPSHKGKPVNQGSINLNKKIGNLKIGVGVSKSSNDKNVTPGIAIQGRF